jgi:hypothetical protein
MSARTRDAWEHACMVARDAAKERDDDDVNFRSLLVAACACDDAGKPLFKADALGTPIFEKAELDALGQQDATFIEPIFEVARRVNRLRNEDMEELRKNFGTAAAAASSTDSPPPAASA